MSQAAFILGIVLINFSLFLPNYFINKDEAVFFPDLPKLNRFRGKGIWVDHNLDGFRISIDVTLLIFISYLLKSEGFIFILPGYYVFIQVFNLYHCSFRKIYKIHPAIINDFKLMRTGIGFLWEESKIKLILITLSGLLGLVGLFLLLRFYARFVVGLETNLLIVIGGVIFFSLYIFKASRERFYDHIYDLVYRFSFFPFRIYGNIRMSYHILRSKKKLSAELEAQKNRKPLRLQTKPNIHFICIESYGSILLKNEELRAQYLPIYEQFALQLEHIGYSSTSTLSESPSIIGPSWLSYTTLLLGLGVKSNHEYEYLLANDPAQHDTLPKSLQRNGYTSFHLNPIKPHSGISVPYQRIMDLYGIDEFILYDDVPYTGTRFGISETPPDQYVLNFTRERLLKTVKDPYFLFYLTKNSHSPFKSPTQILSDWEAWNDSEDALTGKQFLKIPTFEDYIEAINYQLQVMYDYISGCNGQHIFVLVGDHQPPHLVHTGNYGLETPVHIIAKNQKLISDFQALGFDSSPAKADSHIKHENLRGMLEDALMKHYG